MISYWGFCVRKSSMSENRFGWWVSDSRRKEKPTLPIILWWLWCFQMQKYFQMKKESPDLFCVSPSSELHDILKMQIQQTLPIRDAHGSVVYVFRVRKLISWRPNIEYIFNLVVFFNLARKLWSVQMRCGKGFSEQRTFTWKRDPRSTHTNWWPYRFAWHGWCWFCARKISFAAFGQKNRSSDTGSVPHAIQGISHLARAILFRCYFGHFATVSQRENAPPGGWECSLILRSWLIVYCSHIVRS